MPALDQFVKCLLHCDGADGSASFPDSSGHTHTTTPSGGVTVSGTLAKFGSGAAHFPGGPSSYLFGDGSADFAFGTGDFTIEMWMLASAFNTTGNTLIDGRLGSGSAAGGVLFAASNAGTATMLYVSAAGIGINGTTPLPTAVWVHVAVSRSGGLTRMFVGGVQDGPTIVDSANYVAYTNRPMFGNSYGGAAFLGNLDEIVVSKGIGRYTTNFIPPQSPWLPVNSLSAAALATASPALDKPPITVVYTIGAAILALPRIDDYNVTYSTNEDWIDEVPFLDAIGNPISLDGISFDMMVRHKASDATVFLVGSTDDGSLYTEGNVLLFDLPADAMERAPVGTHVYDVVATAGAHTRIAVRGSVAITEGITR